MCSSDLKTFKVVAEHLSAKNAYIKAATLNGKPLERVFIRHEEIMQGGELHFVMGTKAEAAWSTQPLDAPYSMTAAH